MAQHCATSAEETLQRRALTFLAEFAGEAVHAAALLPGPVVHAGAPVSAGAGAAGSLQSRTSVDTMTHKLTISVTGRPRWAVGWFLSPCGSTKNPLRTSEN